MESMARVARVLKAGKILRVQKLMRGAALEAYENAMATSASARLALKAQHNATIRNDMARNESKRIETKRNETKRNETKRNGGP